MITPEKQDLHHVDSWSVI